MAALSSGTQRVTPVFAFHDQTWAATFHPHGPHARSADHSPAAAASFAEPAAPIVRPRRRATPAVLCTAFLLLGIVVGHEVREGRAYAAGLSGGAPGQRAPHVATVAGAPLDHHARAKDAGPSQDDRPTNAAGAPVTRRLPKARAAIRAGVTRPSPDPLFVDFEPSFQVDR